MSSMSPATQEMKSSIEELTKNMNEKTSQKVFQKEMNSFLDFFQRYESEFLGKKKKKKLEWEKIKQPTEKQLQRYEALKTCLEKKKKKLLSQLVVMKLNGGLGTSMGCTGPKSKIQIREKNSFLDLVVTQIQQLNKTYQVDVPLVLMNSFNTSHETKQMIDEHHGKNVNILCFNQKKYPRVYADTLKPVPKRGVTMKSATGSEEMPSGEFIREEWYPPGHGDIYDSFYSSDLFSQLLKQGKRYVFLSNVDNLGAIVDLNILNYLTENDIEFCMEVTQKTRADVKGGTLINYRDKLTLLELASVPRDKISEFKSIRKFKIFNTNNLWFDMNAVERYIEPLRKLDTIVNKKTYKGRSIIQLETACGSAMHIFKRGVGIKVLRNRFLPVKKTSDLFLIQSNVYEEKNGVLVFNEKRVDKVGDRSTPRIKLGAKFKMVNDYLSRFGSIPDILELEDLTISGDVTFGKNCVLKGSVVIIANDGCRINIPDGSVFENKIVVGNLSIKDN